MSLNVAIYAPYAGLCAPHFETDLELAQRHLDAGDRVTVFACHGELEGCDLTTEGAQHACIRCRGRRAVGMSLLEGDLHETSFYCLTDEQRRELDSWRPPVRSHQELAAVEVENFDLGWAVLSSIVSAYRDPEIDLDAHRDELDRLMRAAWMAYYSMRNHLQRERFDQVYLWNGRQAPMRAAMRACEAENVPALMHERGHDLRHFEIYRGAMPHDRDYITEEIEQRWQAAGNDSDRTAAGEQWFNQRAAGVSQAWKSFVADQKSGLLPDGWDSSRENIVIFPSSEDEFVAIGEGWKNPLFESQLAGLEYLLAAIDDDPRDLHVTLRVHPNLAGIDNGQTRGLKKLRSPRLTVIEPKDPISTYALLHAADKVLTFGSTIGIEAVFWGKPSVLAGMSYYRDLGATYNPETPEQMVELLRARLEPKDRLPAVKYGHYQATFGTPFKHFTPSSFFKGRFKNRRIRVPWSASAKARVVRWLEPWRRAA